MIDTDRPSFESEPRSGGIPLFRPGFDADVLAALEQTFSSGWLGAGPRVGEFEERFADWVGARYAVAVTSGTAALHLSCLALDLEEGDEVLVPSLSFVSTAHAPAFCGARPVFVDVDEATCTLDVEDLRRKITPQSKAVIPVHYGGIPCALDAIRRVAEEHGLQVVEDAAHACGAEFHGRRIGSCEHSLTTCFSFNALKNLSTGDGGMITTNSEKTMQLLRRLRWMGIRKDTFERMAPAETPPDSSALQSRAASYAWFYEVTELGFKYLMNDVTATIGIVQLEKLPRAQQRRQEMAAAYTRSFRDLAWLDLPPEASHGSSAWHLYPLRTDFRDALQEHLKRNQIATSVHYYPLHLQAYYRRPEVAPLPVTERLAERLLSIPFHPNLKDSEIEAVIQSVRDFKPEG